MLRRRAQLGGEAPRNEESLKCNNKTALVGDARSPFRIQLPLHFRTQPTQPSSCARTLCSDLFLFRRNRDLSNHSGPDSPLTSVLVRCFANHTRDRRIPTSLSPLFIPPEQCSSVRAAVVSTLTLAYRVLAQIAQLSAEESAVVSVPPRTRQYLFRFLKASGPRYRIRTMYDTLFLLGARL